MTANITGFSVGQGLATALDTLCSQAFTGAEDKKVLGCHLQRSIVVMAIITVPILVLWSYTESILILLGQDPEISRLSGTFIKYLSPGLFPYLVYSCVLRYLQAQNIMKASLYIMLASAPVNIFLQWFLVWSPYGFGAIGAPMATSITNMLLPILLIIYAARYEGYECWGGWNWKEALDLRQLGYFWSLGIPGVAMICSEWWAFEVVALMAGLIGEKYTLTITSRHLAAQSIVLNTGSLCFMVPLGLSVGTSTRVGNSLGAKKPFIARNASISAFFLALMFASLNCTMLLLAKDVWGYLYTQDETVVRLVSEVLPLAAFFQVNDGLSAVASGILRGWYNLYLKVSGRQALGAALNLTGYYALGLPLGILFTFTLRFGLLGIWLGLTIGITFVAYIGLYIICYKTDWPEQVVH